MAVRKIDKPEWRAFFDWLSQGLLGARAEIEVASLDLGDQIDRSDGGNAPLVRCSQLRI